MTDVLSVDRDRLIHILVVHYDMFRDKAEEAADLFLHDKTLSTPPVGAEMGAWQDWTDGTKPNGIVEVEWFDADIAKHPTEVNDAAAINWSYVARWRSAPPRSDKANVDWVMVPRAALDWLDGSGPDANGHWFGDAPDDAPAARAFWWRSKFRAMLGSASPAVPNTVGEDIRKAALEEAAKLADDMSNPYKGGARGVAQEQSRALAAAIRSLVFQGARE